MTHHLLTDYSFDFLDFIMLSMFYKGIHYCSLVAMSNGARKSERKPIDWENAILTRVT